MIFRRFALSANMPPRGESKIVGTIEIAKRLAKIVAEPVTSKMYMDNANLRMVLPKRELICPKSNNVKLRLNNFEFIGFPLFHTFGMNVNG